MTTRTGNPEAAHYGQRRRWAGAHPYASTVAIIALAVVCGALFGLLISAFEGSPGQATIHRAGGAHARASAPLTTQTSPATGEKVTAATDTGAALAAQPLGGQDEAQGATMTRSPARGGFAVGRGLPAANADQP